MAASAIFVFAAELAHAFRPGADEVTRIAAMDEGARRKALRALLDEQVCFGPCTDSVFRFEVSLRPALRALLDDPGVTEQARQLLVMIGEPEDLRLLVRLQDPPLAGPIPERWRYGLATALLNPDDEAEWSFLKDCAAGRFGDLWVQSGGIQTLRLIASPRSRAILTEARQINRSNASSLEAAIRYIDSKPAPLEGTDFNVLAKQVGQALAHGTVLATGMPRFNESQDKALVDIELQSGDDELIYTAAFHKIGGVWVLRGAEETLRKVFSIIR